MLAELIVQYWWVGGVIGGVVLGLGMIKDYLDGRL